MDDALDRAGDFECGLRRSVSRALDDDDYDDHRGHDDRDRNCDRDRDRDRDRDDHDDDDWDGHGDRRRRRGPGRRRSDGPRRRLGPDEGEPYEDPDELTALKDQLELLRGRMDRRWREEDRPGERGRVPRARGAEDAESLKGELARLADRIDRIRDAR
ncbi:hypothetical protein [Streptomyces sp. NPDC017260]|uniref:hypothetical protein n=1 Tax=unclassified Streptomyces TaxID=2593676 RepID=UPI0037AFEF5A